MTPATKLKVNRILFIFAVATALIVSLGACGHRPEETVTTDGGKLTYVAGALRMDEVTHQWFIEDDEEHSPINIDQVLTNANGSVTVVFSFTSKEIINFMVTPDEQYGYIGLTAGASVAMDRATIVFNKTVDEMAIHRSNIFVFGIFR